MAENSNDDISNLEDDFENIEEITVSNMITIEALINLLHKKGLITHEEVEEECKRIEDDLTGENRLGMSS